MMQLKGLQQRCSLQPTWRSSTPRSIFFNERGVHLARKGFAASVTWQKAFSPVAELITSLVEDFDCMFYICSSCVKPYGLEGAEWIKNAEVKPGSYLGELLMNRQNITF
jgi:predicted peroxiredoxin